MSAVAEGQPLLPAVAQGDLAAFEELYDRYSATLYGILLRILSTPEDAQETLQDVFLKAWRSAGTFDPARGTEIAWLISIARSRAIDRLRSRSVRIRREDEAGKDISIRTGDVESSTGSDHAVASQQRMAVRDALRDLPEPQRIALELAYFEGLSQSEIAQRTGDPLGTIKTRMQLGMKKLRERLRAHR
jgi:RNA polymerase sigma-70 factor (ECF subfamily)